jgi:hypothetical protein
MACVKSWQVYNFGSYIPIKHKGHVSHTAIQITYNVGGPRIYEWGNEMRHTVFNKEGEGEGAYYTYPDPDRAWFGVTGQSGEAPDEVCITKEMIDDENEKWRTEHDAGGQYPSNCRGYAHYIIRYMRGSTTPDTPLKINDPAYNLSCASSQGKPMLKRKAPAAHNATNNANKHKSKNIKKGGKRTLKSRISKRLQRTMKIKRTKQ